MSPSLFTIPSGPTSRATRLLRGAISLRQKPLNRSSHTCTTSGYTPVTFDDLVNHITKNIPLPPKPVIMSFDDDWESQYTYALPLLKKYGFTATFYIWVAVVGKKHHMSWDEIRALRAAGMQIGCHSMTHPYLTRVQKDETLRQEIHGAKQIIESHVGVPVTTFAYPFGQYNERVVAAVKEAGFTSARSTWPGVVHSEEGLFSLTGLLRTESEPSLVAAMERYLAEAEQWVRNGDSWRSPGHRGGRTKGSFRETRRNGLSPLPFQNLIDVNS